MSSNPKLRSLFDLFKGKEKDKPRQPKESTLEQFSSLADKITAFEKTEKNPQKIEAFRTLQLKAIADAITQEPGAFRTFFEQIKYNAPFAREILSFCYDNMQNPDTWTAEVLHQLDKEVDDNFQTLEVSKTSPFLRGSTFANELMLMHVQKQCPDLITQTQQLCGSAASAANGDETALHTALLDQLLDPNSEYRKPIQDALKPYLSHFCQRIGTKVEALKSQYPNSPWSTPKTMQLELAKLINGVIFLRVVSPLVKDQGIGSDGKPYFPEVTLAIPSGSAPPKKEQQPAFKVFATLLQTLANAIFFSDLSSKYTQDHQYFSRLESLFQTAGDRLYTSALAGIDQEPLLTPSEIETRTQTPQHIINARTAQAVQDTTALDSKLSSVPPPPAPSLTVKSEKEMSIRSQPSISPLSKDITPEHVPAPSLQSHLIMPAEQEKSLLKTDAFKACIEQLAWDKTPPLKPSAYETQKEHHNRMLLMVQTKKLNGGITEAEGLDTLPNSHQRDPEREPNVRKQIQALRAAYPTLTSSMPSDRYSDELRGLAFLLRKTAQSQNTAKREAITTLFKSLAAIESNSKDKTAVSSEIQSALKACRQKMPSHCDSAKHLDALMKHFAQPQPSATHSKKTGG